MRDLRKLQTYFLFVFCFLLVFPLSVFAGVTGKIAGKVIDDASSDGLFGATVMIDNSNMGNKAGPDGSYYIINVPPGTYTLTASMIGYTSIKVEKVKVMSDQTTEIDFGLKTEAVTLQRSITVTAERPIIDKGITANLRTISTEEVSLMPVKAISDVLKSQVGFVVRNQELHVRGGRAGEVNYIVDGVETKSLLGGLGLVTPGMNIATEDVEEMNILKGGFDAEYGNIQSAAVNIITKEGSSKKTDVRIDFLTDDLGSKDLNKYSFNTDRLEFSIGGPEKLFSEYLLPNFLTRDLLPSLGIDITGGNLTYRLSGSVYKTNTNMDVNKFATPTTQKQYRVDKFLGFDVPERMQNLYTAQLKLSYKMSPTQKLIFSYNGNWERYTLYFDPTSATRGDLTVWRYRYTPMTLPQFETSTKTYSLLYTHNVSRSSFYEVTLSNLSSDFLMAPGDPYNAGRGVLPDWYQFSDSWESYFDVNANGIWDKEESYVDVNVNGRYDRGEPFEDADGDGFWSQAEPFYDTPDSEDPADSGNGVYDPEKARWSGGNDGVDNAEPYRDGDILLGEPFKDINGDGIYQEVDENGLPLDFWDPVKDDLNGNGIYDGPNSDPCPGEEHCKTAVRYVDLNNNGMFDKPNGRWDPGEAYADVNGNGKYDGKDFFYDRGYERRCYYQHRTEDRWTLDFKFTSQITKEHQLKTGLKIQRQRLTMEDVRYPYIVYNGLPDGGDWPDHGIFRDFYDHKPAMGALFIMDNIEYGEMIAKLGARFDFFIHSDDVVYMTEEERDKLSQNPKVPLQVTRDKNKISPRIGVSYPILEKAKVYFNYGHFYELPELRFMYARPTQGSSGIQIYGNPNVSFSKSIAYEFGLQYAISNSYKLDLSGFYKDYFGLINTIQYKRGPATWEFYDNVDYGRARGIEAELEKMSGGYVMGRLNYQYAFAFGKSSAEVSNYYARSGNQQIAIQEYPLDWDVRHQITLNLDLRIPKDDHPKIFGLKVPDNWGVNVIWQYGTGFPYTPDVSYPGVSKTLRRNEDPIPNSKRMSTSSNVDMRFNKDFDFWKFSYSFTIWINNLFDRKNVNNVFNVSGRYNTSRSYFNDYLNEYVVLPGSEVDNNPYNLGAGRNIRLGLTVTF
ncbi:MAG: TonB-dependent receptor [candidate division Zixibacteria bacterium]|nr:TonB-dependent receptor [candidate division Zixibacteria bacterium]